MENIKENLYIGDKNDFFEYKDDENVSLCLCAKTFHKMFAKAAENDFEGYRGNMSKLEKEYLIAERPDRHLIAFNLIDVQDHKWIPEKIIIAALNFITQEIEKGRKVLVICDQGKSRSASIALMWMMAKTDNFSPKEFDNFEELEYNYKRKHESYEPKDGIKYYSKKLFNEIKINEGGADIGKN